MKNAQIFFGRYNLAKYLDQRYINKKKINRNQWKIVMFTGLIKCTSMILSNYINEISVSVPNN